MPVELYPGMAVSGVGTVPLEAVARDGGLKVMLDLLAGIHPAPPMAATLKFSLSEVEEGRVMFRGYFVGASGPTDRPQCKNALSWSNPLCASSRVAAAIVGGRSAIISLS